MADDKELRDLQTRQRQLETHLLRSPEYLFKADQDLKRQVVILYLAIALLIVFGGFFALREMQSVPLGITALIGATSLLAIVNCVLLIRTRNYLHRLNRDWLKPEEKLALDHLQNQQAALRKRTPPG